MGNNLCQCEVICERNKEKDFSSSRDLSRIKSVKSMKNDNYKIDSTKCNNKIQNIYLINSVKKIERVYLIYKNRKKEIKIMKIKQRIFLIMNQLI